MVANPMVQFDPFPHIPSELKVLNNWCVWQYQITPYGRTKVPRNPISHTHKADSTDPSTWVSYEVALANLQGYEGLGFFFSKSAGYTGVDLDDPFSRKDKSIIQAGDPDYEAAAKTSEQHGRIYNACQSYAELSPSGKGAHIIIKGSIPRGVKSPIKKVEMYDEARFFTMTGQAIRIAPIYEEQEFLTELFASIGKLKDAEGFDPADKPEVDDDETIYNRASNAINGDKFLKLWAGNSDGYPSDSEAHQALMNIIAFYTDNFAQCKRMFLFSKMSAHPKASRPKYLDLTVKRAFDQKPPTIEALTNMSNDFNALLARQREAAGNPEGLQPAAQVQEGKGNNPPALLRTKAFTPPNTSPEWVLNPPPGLIRDAANFIHDAAYLQVREIALAGAVGLMAGICGRAFNVKGTGLNLYLAMLSPTGRGKEAISSGLGMIQESITMSNTLADNKIIGPGDFASGQGLQRHLSKNNCFVSIIGEFDNFVSKMHGPKASDTANTLKQAILDCYNKSGHGNSFRGSVYSDIKNNIDAVRSPALSFIGECTIAGMKEIVNDKMINSGMLPRILTFVYDGKRHYENEKPLKIQDEATGLIQRLVILFGAAYQINAHNRVCNIEFEPEAEQYRKDMSKFVTDYMNAHKDDGVIENLYNRALQNVMRLAALCSISIENGQLNMNAKIKLEHMMWAACVVWRSIEFWTQCFGNHEVGEQNNELAQLRDVRNVIRKWQAKDNATKLGYGATQQMINENVVTMRYLQQALWRMASFRNSHIQKGDLFKKVIQTMIDNGEVVSIKDKRTGLNKYNGTSEGFTVISLFDEKG